MPILFTEEWKSDPEFQALPGKKTEKQSVLRINFDQELADDDFFSLLTQSRNP